MTSLVAMKTALPCSEVLGRGGSREDLGVPGCKAVSVLMKEEISSWQLMKMQF